MPLYLKKRVKAAVALLVLLAGRATIHAQGNKEVSALLKDYQLVWHDEFDGAAIDTAKWNFRGESTKRNYARVAGQKTISLDGNGHAVIKVLQKEGLYYVGQLSTDRHFNSLYGYYECRAKMNHSVGPHIAFWLQSPSVGQKPFNNTKKNGSEIDIFEYHRKQPQTVWQTIHINGYGTQHRQLGRQIIVPDIDTGFHTFGLLWTKDRYIFYIDGTKTWETSFGISNRPEFMILSTELTGFGGDPASGHYPDSVVYDYVRVYQPRRGLHL